MLNAVNENGEKQESFNAGENIIKITMQKDDMSLTYTIKVNKKESEETVETVSDAVLESENKKQTNDNGL